MAELLGCCVIILALFLLACCIHELGELLHERSNERTAARRAASFPKTRKRVHDEWTVMRNRNDLWESVTFRKEDHYEHK